MQSSIPAYPFSLVGTRHQLPGKKVPTRQSLNEEYHRLLSGKKEAYAEYRQVKKAGVTGIDIGQLAQKVYDHFPNFKVKKLGYATFQKLVHSIRALQVENVGNNQKNVYLKR